VSQEECYTVVVKVDGFGGLKDGGYGGVGGSDSNSSGASGGYILFTMIVFLEIIHHLSFLFRTQPFGDWILSPSTNKTYSLGPNQQS
jgi:hypothetical protein